MTDVSSTTVGSLNERIERKASTTPAPPGVTRTPWRAMSSIVTESSTKKGATPATTTRSSEKRSMVLSARKVRASVACRASKVREKWGTRPKARIDSRPIRKDEKEATIGPADMRMMRCSSKATAP